MKKRGRGTDDLSKPLNSVSKSLKTEAGKINLGIEIIFGLIAGTAVIGGGIPEIINAFRNGSITNSKGLSGTLLAGIVFSGFVFIFGVICLCFVYRIHLKNINDAHATLDEFKVNSKVDSDTVDAESN